MKGMIKIKFSFKDKISKVINNISKLIQGKNGDEKLLLSYRSNGDAPKLNVVKCSDKLAAFVGDIITYTIDIKNVGTITAENIIITDILPDNTGFVSNSFSINGVLRPDIISITEINLGNLAPNNSIELSYQVIIFPQTTPIELTNTAILNYEFRENSSIVGGTAVSNELPLLIKNGLTDDNVLDYIAGILQNSTDEFCNIIVPELKEMSVDQIYELVDELQKQLSIEKCTESRSSASIQDIVEKLIEKQKENYC